MRINIIVFLLVATIPLYAQSCHKDMLIIDSIYNITENDSTKTLVEWLLEHDKTFRGKTKHMQNINDYLKLVALDQYIEKEHKYNVAGVGGSTQPSSIVVPGGSTSWNSYYVGVAGINFHHNLHIQSPAYRIFYDGLRYGKYPVVWIINDTYSMITGYHRNWTSYTYSWETPPTLCDPNAEPLYPYIDDIIIPEHINDVVSIKLTYDNDILHRHFYSGQRIFDVHPLVIYITTK